MKGGVITHFLNILIVMVFNGDYMNERRYYVYVLIDTNSDIRYVGEGTGGRSKHVSGRCNEYKRLVEQGAETLILYDSLTKKEARKLEQSLIDRFIGNGLLLNKRVDNKNIVNDLTYAEAFELFDISENSPSGLVWKKKVSKNTVAGKHAGNLDPSGYWRVQLNWKRYRVHRIIWVLHNKKDIDSSLVVNHIDSNQSNNCVTNLELITQKINSFKKIKPDIDKKAHSAPTGISKMPQINEKLFRYKATVVAPDGKILSKSFSTNKYGDKVALLMAVSWRNNLLNEFYNQA